ncbi:OmpA family protein [Dinoroseobacter sp. S76]|uniref:OmpA family protein n=1 Tax=Dinoroseobacter sp. S76 TaxID=3415124 RepID=UPI003C7B9419
MKWLAGIVPACLASTLGAQELALPEGATLIHDESEPAIRAVLPSGAAQGGTVPTATLEGDARHRVWRLVPSHSIASLLASLGPQVEAAGFSPFLTCETWECGGYSFRLAMPDVDPPTMIVDLGRFGYIGAEGATGTALAFILSTTRDSSYVQLTTVTPVGIAAPAVVGAAQVAAEPLLDQPADPGDFSATLLETGGIVLEDLRFEPGSATLAAGSFASLTSLAAFLRENPTRRVVLVGHSDAQGSTAGNMALSKRRAEAVRARLLAEFDVPGSQVQADGVGYLAPRASNDTEDGREANRRVEAVLVQP